MSKTLKLELDEELFDEESKKNTPWRWARFQQEWKEKRDYDKWTCFETKGGQKLVILKDIDFASLCTHHLLPFTGKVHVGYISNKKICGISKLARIVDKFASKPQLQERMGEEIADFIEKILEPKGVMVVIEGEHMCMRMRGVGKQNSVMITSEIRGVFKNESTRMEFLKLIGK